MTIQECYEKLGGNYAQLEMRLPSAALIKKFITKFLDDGSYAQLCQAMQEGNREDAFRAAHTLKGVCGNLSLDKLYSTSSKLTELLRPNADAIPDGAALLLEELQQDYAMTVSIIHSYLAQDGCI